LSSFSYSNPSPPFSTPKHTPFPQEKQPSTLGTAEQPSPHAPSSGTYPLPSPASPHTPAGPAPSGPGPG